MAYSGASSGSLATRVVFLGGVGEIGRNMTLFEHAGKILVVDVGLMFPSEQMLGVDLVLPDFQYLRDRADQVIGVLLSHGHEDHIGGLPYLLKELKLPVYGSKLTLGILRYKLEEHGLADDALLEEVRAPGSLKLGPFDLRFFNMAHSIPDALATLITTGAGRILYTSDFKIDPDPIGGRPTDLHGLGEAAATGIDLLMADSTNADHPGHTPSERTVGEPIAEAIRSSDGRVIVACFASNIHRIQQVVNAAEQSGRLVSFLGRSMINNVSVAREMGYLNIPEELIVPVNETDDYAPEKIVIISTGSQGEPFSALSLMAAREHKWIELTEGDTVVLSATAVPGNEAAVRRVIDGLYRIGARVVAPPSAPVHVSGHAASADLRLLLDLIKPNWFVPVHGEYRHLAIHAGIAREAGIPDDRILVVDGGDVLELEGGALRRAEPVEAGFVFVDGLGIGDVEEVVLRDRRLLADEGVVVCVVTIDARTGQLLAGPDVISRGFVVEEEAGEFLDEAKAEIRESLATLAEDEVTDWSAITRNVRRSLGKFVWRRTGRRPIILPVVMEV
ncbi:MAG: ribonuclease J [Actinomycetota bacterium]|nr:ribonuclease J [Actinomycetota bacterium]